MRRTGTERGSQQEEKGEGNEKGEGATGKATAPNESREDVSVHGLWKWGTYALFDMRIVNLDTVSYLSQSYAKALATVETKKTVRVPPAMSVA